MTGRSPPAAAQEELFEQPTGRQLDGGSELFHRRDLGVAFAGLDPADLGGVDAAAFSDLLLSQLEARAGFPQVGTEVAHAGIVGPARSERHRGLHNFW
jgi:hypothetical protein